MGDNVKFLRKNYKQNTFDATGRKVPRTGGIILAQAESRDRNEANLAEDQFIRHHLANVTITEFQTSQMHPGFKALMELLSAG
jgi:uncharacterized protein YciI